jgi:hypothetical protein
VLPAEPEPGDQRPGDLVLAEATGRSPGRRRAARRQVRSVRRRRRLVSAGHAVRAALSRKLGIAVLVTLAITVMAGAVLANADNVHGFWRSLYVTLLTAVGASDVELHRPAVAQFAQLLLTLSGVALLPLVTAAVVEGMVNARLALSNGRVRRPSSDHIVLVGLVLSTDDVTNLKAALNARAVRPDVRVVLRLFDSDFAGRVQTAFDINISRSVSRLVAPAFAAAMLDRDVVVTIPVDRHALLVASVQVLAGSPLAGAPLRAADRPFSVRAIGLSASDSEWVDWSPDLDRRLQPGDRILVVARRAGLRVLLEAASPPPLEQAGLDAAQ